MEYAYVICCPYHINLIDRIENVPSRITKRLFGLHDISYVDWLMRKIHTDLIMLYKILNDLICVNIDNCLTLSMSNTRGNVCVNLIVKYYSRIDIRKYFLHLRVFDIWNSLPDIIC